MGIYENYTDRALAACVRSFKRRPGVDFAEREMLEDAARRIEGAARPEQITRTLARVASVKECPICGAKRGENHDPFCVKGNAESWCKLHPEQKPGRVRDPGARPVTNETDIFVLTLLRDNMKNNWVSTFKALAEKLNMPEKKIRMSCRRLARAGMARRQAMFHEDDGMLCGSGYEITEIGMLALQAAEEKRGFYYATRKDQRASRTL